MNAYNPPPLAEHPKATVTQKVVIAAAIVVGFVIAPLIMKYNLSAPTPDQDAKAARDSAKWRQAKDALNEERRRVYGQTYAYLSNSVARLYGLGLLVTVDVAHAEAQVNDTVWGITDFDTKRSYADFLSTYCQFYTKLTMTEDRKQRPIKIRSASSGAVLLEINREGEVIVPYRF